MRAVPHESHGERAVTICEMQSDASDIGPRWIDYGIKKMSPAATPPADIAPSALHREQQCQRHGGQLPGR